MHTLRGARGGLRLAGFTFKPSLYSPWEGRRIDSFRGDPTRLFLWGESPWGGLAGLRACPPLPQSVRGRTNLKRGVSSCGQQKRGLEGENVLLLFPSPEATILIYSLNLSFIPGGFPLLTGPLERADLGGSPYQDIAN